jgi:hypothetical protein
MHSSVKQNLPQWITPKRAGGEDDPVVSAPGANPW